MKGCLGCLGALVVLALLAWPIDALGQLFGWSDTQTGWVLLLVLGLLAIGAAGRRGCLHASGAGGDAAAPPPRVRAA